MRYLLNSAVITGEGVYLYQVIDKLKFIAILGDPANWVSRIGYKETADHIRAISGREVPLSREASPMKSGDSALVCRLKYRVNNPAAKGQMAPSDDDWEYGYLTCR